MTACPFCNQEQETKDFYDHVLAHLDERSLVMWGDRGDITFTIKICPCGEIIYSEAGLFVHAYGEHKSSLYRQPIGQTDASLEPGCQETLRIHILDALMGVLHA